eukprot:2504546-Prymnesium_polylepis.2
MHENLLVSRALIDVRRRAARAREGAGGGWPRERERARARARACAHTPHVPMAAAPDAAASPRTFLEDRAPPRTTTPRLSPRSA